ncbi:hypothetical protein LOAG_11801 [Loa loa]|uniref:Uncharacterized protein n=1 Tax=Loa loa TaxID=7209 RepID=A0A1S0TME1_LOALO|nr:hypothetical protein LOAG_11801 [Loa loa]EFO16702.2 hypothetical protein LOAG_11801 [Loa loa]
MIDENELASIPGGQMINANCKTDKLWDNEQLIPNLINIESTTAQVEECMLT